MREDGGQRREDRGISNPSTVLRTGIEQGMTNYEGKKEVNGYQVIRTEGYQVKEEDWQGIGLPALLANVKVCGYFMRFVSF